MGRLASWMNVMTDDKPKSCPKCEGEMNKRIGTLTGNELLSYMAIIIFPVFLLLFLISHMLNKQHSQEWYDNHYG